jgi:Ras-related protein Rab-7A
MHNKKILLTGYNHCGKSALVNRFVNKRFSHGYSCDQQLRIAKKEVAINQKKVNLIIWTAPGNSSQIKSFKSHYLGTDALVHVVDVNQPSSFSDLESWMIHYKKHLPDVPLYIACNKIESNINLDCSDFFTDFDCYRIFFTSAKNNFMVSEMFEAIAADLLNESYHHKIKIY